MTSGDPTDRVDQDRHSSTDNDPTTVLVTGGSGYLASWTIVELLRQGYRVRTTMRSRSAANSVLDKVSTQISPGDRLSFAEADLRYDDGWSDAVAGARYVLHMASPMDVERHRGTDLIEPAVAGTGRVLRAARDAGVARVVLTSSVEAAIPADPDAPATDEVWSDLDEQCTPAPTQYRRAKTMAERQAWSFIDEHAGEMEMAAVLPGFMQGPVLDGIASGSSEVVALLLAGKMPALPRIGWPVVDVRDIADLHIRAMTSPAAAGERFVGAAEFLWLEDIATILRHHLGDDARRVPVRRFPAGLVRLAARVSPELRQIVPILNQRQDADAAKATRVLGWMPRPIESTIVDGAVSIISGGSERR